jgi:hypothetical protein
MRLSSWRLAPVDDQEVQRRMTRAARPRPLRSTWWLIADSGWLIASDRQPMADDLS